MGGIVYPTTFLALSIACINFLTFDSSSPFEGVMATAGNVLLGGGASGVVVGVLVDIFLLQRSEDSTPTYGPSLDNADSQAVSQTLLFENP